MEPGLEVFKAYDPPPMTYSNATPPVPRGGGRANRTGGHRTLSGGGKLRHHHQPPDRRGQQHGATAMGLSGTLFEHVV